MPTGIEISPVRRRGRVLIPRRRGIVLLIVLVVVVVLALAAYAFTELMLSELEATQQHGRNVQTRVIADSGVDLVRARLMQSGRAPVEHGGDYDNPAVFRGRVVEADDTGCGVVAVLSPHVANGGSPAAMRYGLEDESSRINVNALLLADRVVENGGHRLLWRLPGITEEIADAILDWIDPDSEPRPYGAEADYSAALDPPYAPSNGPLATVDELLLVRGVTPQRFYGVDHNHNGQVDPHEAARLGSSEVAAPLGWSRFLTIYSQEANVTAEGKPRIYLNGDDQKQLYEQVSSELSEEWAAFIVAWRQNGPFLGSREAEPLGDRSLDLRGGPRYRIGQVLDLVGARTLARIEGEDDGDAIVVLESPISESNFSRLPELVDKVSVIPSRTIPGRININQAPREVLLGIPGMDELTVEAVLALRQPDLSLAPKERRHATWLLTEGIVDLPQMRAMAPLVTGRGDVHRCQVIGSFVGGGASTRVELVVDATFPTPQIVLWRDLSHLGRGYSQDLFGAAATERMPSVCTPPGAP
jgi:DNA uptake protein ComE-like DNA-binding protein